MGLLGLPDESLEIKENGIKTSGTKMSQMGGERGTRLCANCISPSVINCAAAARIHEQLEFQKALLEPLKVEILDDRVCLSLRCRLAGF